MKIKESKKENSNLTITLIIEKDEFDEARMKAYIEHTAYYIVPGMVEGSAKLEDLMRTYGPAVLYDEALSETIPAMFTSALKEQRIRIMGKPVVKDISFKGNGDVEVKITAECFPDVVLGQYKGLKASVKKEENPEEYADEIIKKACKGMSGTVPAHMIEQKLDSMLASEKIRINQDAIYHLLADTLYLLKQSFNDAGLNRPYVQTKAIAMDIMLQTVSFDNQQVPEDFLIQQILKETARYRDLPKNFEEKIRGHVKERKDKKAKMKPEEVAEEAFNAYLGSINLTSESWRKERKMEAAKEAAKDILFDKVAEVENLTVLPEEIHTEYERLASQYSVELEKIAEAIPKEILQYQILRDKAKNLILESAC